MKYKYLGSTEQKILGQRVKKGGTIETEVKINNKLFRLVKKPGRNKK